jgi:amino acid transporter
VSKTLGLEVGGTVGIPLFLAQAFSVALYIFGFVETWTFIFPSHDALIVALLAFMSLFFLVFISTRIAVKAQLIVLIIVCISILSIFLNSEPSTGTTPLPLIDFSEIPFWGLFALFFPAATGLMAGVGMSGELSDPKKQIPRGVLSALIITTIIYLSLVIFFGYSSNTEALLADNMILVNLSTFAPLILIGILAATYSSALTTLVAAPRVLMALGEHSILPRSDLLCRKTAKGEPHNAIFITSILILVLLLIGSLNAIAPILTIFFLIAYAMINISVFAEQSLNLVSFRPIFTVPKAIPLYGALSSIVIMFLINVLAGLLSIAFLIIIYMALMNKQFEEDSEDIRSGLFRSMSEWAIRRTRNLPKSRHTWKPNILIPVLTTKTLAGNFPLIKDIAHPFGTMTVLGFNLRDNINKNPEKKDITKTEMERALKELPQLVEKFGESGIFTSFSTIDTREYIEGLIISMEAIESQVFAPNIVFLPYQPGEMSLQDLKRVIALSKKQKSGLLLFDREKQIGVGTEKDIHLWIAPRALETDLYEERYYDLSMLIAYSLRVNWKGRISIWMCVTEKQKQEAERYLSKLLYEARFPESTRINVVVGKFDEVLNEAPNSDIHIIPFRDSDINKITKIAKVRDKSFLFVLDSTEESVLA